MSRKPEAIFISSVKKHLSLNVHCEAMGTGFSNGIPDRYYEGRTYYLWVEYKFLSRIPLLIDLCSLKVQVKLSPLQQKWLSRAHANGINTCVIVGCKEGGVILTKLEWMNPMSREEFKSRIQTRKEIATWITQLVTE